MEVPIDGCVSAKVYKPAPVKRIILLSVLVAIYAVVLPFCYTTAGDPRRAAVINAQQLADEKWAAESAARLDIGNDTTVSGGASTQVVVEEEEEEVVDNQLLSSSSSSSSTTDASAADFTEDSLGYIDFGKKNSSSGGGFLSGWFGPTKEQKRAQQEFEKWQKQFNEKNSEDGPVSLPPEYLPSAWACLALFSTLTFHALFYLLCHWIVWFKAWSLFTPATKAEIGSFVLIKPPNNRGKALMVPVKASSATVGGGFLVEFQRQTYFYTPPGSRSLGVRAAEFPTGVFTLSACPINLPLSFYFASRGLGSELEVDRVLARWGKNHLAVPVPGFLALLQQQLLSPLAIFQVGVVECLYFIWIVFIFFNLFIFIFLF